MSHQPERKEKNCLNCGATVIGRYCHVCGQENVVTRESFWSLTKHFIFDILHFDGKFFYTLKYLFTRPGFVARQYAEGRRESYLHPIRMYLFTSAVFFLIFFAYNKIESASASKNKLPIKERMEMASQYREQLKQNPGDTSLQHKIELLMDTTREVDITMVAETPGISLKPGTYRSLAAYDSAQKALPPEKRDGWISRTINRKGYEASQKYRDDPRGLTRIFLEAFLHKLPYLLFVSLPFFALILQLLYMRHKNFYYSDHAIFTLYHYIFSFILILLIMGLGLLQNQTGWKIFNLLTVALFIAWPVYLWFELKAFYLQSVGKTLVKLLLLNFLGIVVIGLLFIVFLFLSLFQL